MDATSLQMANMERQFGGDAPQSPWSPGRASLDISGKPKSSTLAYVAVVLSCLFFLPLVPVFGLILGIIARSQISASKGALTGGGAATAAIVLGGCFGLALPGLLLAIAIPSYNNFIRKSKLAESTHTLGRLRSVTQTTLIENETLPGTSSDWTPPTPCCKQSDGRCAVDEKLWEQTPWKELGFSMSDPHRFQYRWARDGSNLSLEARADLDCDGDFVTRTLAGKIKEDGEIEFGSLDTSEDGD
jgi:hypothetical protein